MIFDNTRYISKLLKMIKATLLIAILALLILSFAFAQKWYNENIELQCENMELKMDLLILKEKIRSREDDEEIFIEDLENTQRNRQEILDVIEKYKQQKSERSENELKVMKKKWEELPHYFITSSTKFEGKEELLNYIDSICLKFPPPNPFFSQNASF